MTSFGKLVAAGLGGLGSLSAGVMYISSVASDKNIVYAAQRVAESSKDPALTFINGLGNKSAKWDYNWDRRDPSQMVPPLKNDGDQVSFLKELERATPTAVRNLFLIRHGQYDLDGETDKKRVLTAKGVEQAKATGKRLATLNFPYQLMTRSTMTRAQQTGDYILDQLKSGVLPTKDDTMLEEGAPYPPEPACFGYEPLSYEYFQDGSRIEAAFRNYVHRADITQTKDSYELIVCHGNVIRYFTCRALQLPPEAWLRMDLHHASITWLRIWPNGGVTLKCLGDSGHLPPNLFS